MYNMRLHTRIQHDTPYDIVQHMVQEVILHTFYVVYSLLIYIE